MTTLTTYRPTLLGRNVFDDIFNAMDFPTLMNRTTQGYPVADIYKGEDGATVMEFALAGFTKEELSIDVQPEKRSITVSATSAGSQKDRRIARRSFKKTYVNYDDNLDLTAAAADFENGLLTVKVPTRIESNPLTIQIK